ncbi:MAG: 16S rRNA (cytosine(1402)-N(4))-methyltransferase RsmH [Pseudomonadota bacterium]
MLALARDPRKDSPHIPVLLDEVCRAVSPIRGTIVIDATFGAGGYTRAFLEHQAAQVIAIDQDPSALDAARSWESGEDRLKLVEGRFGQLDRAAEVHADGPVGAIVLDIGVSSMQLDQALRGFSFQRDGPLDMHMSGDGLSAADLVNDADEKLLADIIFHYGEDRAARRIARAILRVRASGRIETTLQLAEIVADVLPKPRPGQVHPATRTFQALRIAVNDELGELVRALNAAEAVLSPGGRLAVVTFHSLEDRIVKRFLQQASATSAGGSRHGPRKTLPPPRFERPGRPVEPTQEEVVRNPRARSARLRCATRTDAAPLIPEARAIGLPPVQLPDRLRGGRA